MAQDPTQVSGAGGGATVNGVLQPVNTGGANSTPASLGLSYTPNPTDQKIASTEDQAMGSYPSSPPDEGQIMKDTLANFQNEIDSLNQASAQQKASINAELQQAGKGTAAQNIAAQGKRGLLGSDFGAAQQSNIAADTNTKIANQDNSIDAQNQKDLAALYDKAAQLGQTEYNTKIAAYQKGLDSSIAYLGQRNTRNQANATSFATQAISQGVDLSDPKNAQAVKQYASQIGITPDQLVAAYVAAKQAQEKAAAANDKSVTQGGELVDPVTGQVIATGTPRITNVPVGGTAVNDTTGTVVAQGSPKITNIPRGGTAVSSNGQVVAHGLPPATSSTGGTWNKSQLQGSVNKVDAYFKANNNIGKDGFVSPQTYLNARNAWIHDGGDANTFDTQFGKYANKADIQDYRQAQP